MFDLSVHVEAVGRPFFRGYFVMKIYPNIFSLVQWWLVRSLIKHFVGHSNGASASRKTAIDLS